MYDEEGKPFWMKFLKEDYMDNNSNKNNNEGMEE